MSVNESVIAVVALLVTFGMPIIIVGIALVYNMRRARLKHSTILALAEKGVPIPPELIVSPPKPKSTASDLKIGILLLSAGAGISLFFLEMNGPISLGAVPVLIGLGYIVVWKIEKPQQSVS